MMEIALCSKCKIYTRFLSQFTSTKIMKPPDLASFHRISQRIDSSSGPFDPYPHPQSLAQVQLISRPIVHPVAVPKGGHQARQGPAQRPRHGAANPRGWGRNGQGHGKAGEIWVKTGGELVSGLLIGDSVDFFASFSGYGDRKWHFQ